MVQCNQGSKTAGPHLVHKDVELAQICVHQAAVLVEAPDQQHSLCVERPQLLVQEVCILSKAPPCSQDNANFQIQNAL